MFPHSRNVALALCLSWSALGWAADPKSPSDGFRQVEQMSQLERDRLQRNLAEFKQLTPEQQAHYRDLHLKLEENKATGGSLSSLLQEYSAWLTTLTPSQRDDLNKETDSAKKMALVRRFKEEQDVRSTAPSTGTPEDPNPEFRPMPKRPLMGPVLQPADLSAVMKVIATEARLDSEKAGDESTLNFYREVIQKSIEQSAGGPREWPAPDLLQKLEQAIVRPEQRELLRRNPDFKRQTLIQLIFGGISNQALLELKAMRPSPSDLQKVFESLDQRQREQLTLLPKQAQDFRLEQMYYRDRNDNPLRRMEELQRQIDKLLMELGVPRPQRPGGGEGGRPGFGPGPLGPRDGNPDGPEGGRPGDRGRKANGQDKPRRSEND